MQKRVREEEQSRIQLFRDSISKRVREFDENENQGPSLTFQPMTKPQRAIMLVKLQLQFCVPNLCNSFMLCMCKIHNGIYVIYIS